MLVIIMMAMAVMIVLMMMVIPKLSHKNYTRNTFTHTHAHTHTLLHNFFSTQRLVLTKPFTHRRCYTESFTQKYFYTENTLGTEVFTKFWHTHRWCRFYTQVLLHTNAFTHMFFFTHKQLLQMDQMGAFTCIYTLKLWHTGAFNRRCLATAIAHRNFYTLKTLSHKSLYTQVLSHTQALTHRSFDT